jgi:SAM-dependent methyltransferase
VTSAGYAFGDSDLARERLGLVAETFAPPSRAFLRDLPRGDRRYLIDLGCGPGHTSALLRDAFPHACLTGVDSSEAMIAEARSRVPSGIFFVGDVTAPLRLPAHLVFARLLLGHLPDQRVALVMWARALLPGGVLACEEPVRYRSAIEVFTRYETVVTEVVTARGGTLWASAALDDDPPGCRRALDRVVEHPVPARRVAAMFWRNAVAWDGPAELIEELRAIETSGDDTPVVWELRQTAWIKSGVDRSGRYDPA